MKKNQFYFLDHCVNNFSMDYTVQELFRAALQRLLDKEGRGAQSRLASEQGIDPGYLNGIIKGRKPSSEDIREKTAKHFGYTYEHMLDLGRWILAGKDPEKWRPPSWDRVFQQAAGEVSGQMAEEGNPYTTNAENSCQQSIPPSAAKYVMQCQKLSSREQGRNLLEVVFDLAQNDTPRFQILLGEAQKLALESKKERREVVAETPKKNTA